MRRGGDSEEIRRISHTGASGVICRHIYGPASTYTVSNQVIKIATLVPNYFTDSAKYSSCLNLSILRNKDNEIANGGMDSLLETTRTYIYLFYQGARTTAISANSLYRHVIGW